MIEHNHENEGEDVHGDFHIVAKSPEIFPVNYSFSFLSHKAVSGELLHVCEKIHNLFYVEKLEELKKQPQDREDDGKHSSSDDEASTVGGHTCIDTYDIVCAHSALVEAYFIA